MITWRKSTSQALWIDEILLPVFLTASRCPQYIDQGTINSAGHNIWAHHTLCESISQSVRAVGYRIEDRERVMIGVLRGPRRRVQSMYSMGHADLYNYFWSAPTWTLWSRSRSIADEWKCTYGPLLMIVCFDRLMTGYYGSQKCKGVIRW